MKTPQLKLPNIKLPNRRVVYIVAGTLVLALLFSFAMVHQVRAKRAEDARVAAQTAEYTALKQEVVGLREQNKQLATANSFNASKAESVCDWVRSTQPKYRYTVPPLCVKR